MQKTKYVLIASLLTQACAIFDGYKDNQHSWYAKDLTSVEKILINKGQTIEWEFNSTRKKGELIIMKGDTQFGEYNFVEVGDWKELVNYSSGDFVRGQMFIETTFDNYGNVLSRTVHDKRKRDSEFHKNQTWSSEIRVFRSDSILTQKVKTFSKDGIQRSEFTLGVLNYKQKLSDRLKTKIRVGREIIFDDKGNTKKETYYRYERSEERRVGKECRSRWSPYH